MNDRIIILAASFPPDIGGIASLLHVLIKHMPIHRITVAAYPAIGWQDFDSLQPFSIWRPTLPISWQKMTWRFNLLAPWFLWSILRCNPQTIICGQSHPAVLLPAWIAKNLIGASYGVFLHGRDVHMSQYRGLLYRRISTFLLKNADFVIPNSHATEDIALRIGVNQSRLHMIFPSVDPDDLIPARSTEEIKALHGVQGKRVILYIGNLSLLKGLDKLLEAMPHVLSSFPDAHLLVIGKGPHEEEFKKLANRLGLQEEVTFVGNIPHEQIASYFAACEYFIMVSREIYESKNKVTEGFGIVYLEAGLLGKPVIGGRSGGVMDAVVDGKTGILVDPLNIMEIAEAMILLLRDPGYAENLGEEGRNRVYSNFTGSVIAKQVITLIDTYAKKY